MKSHLVLAVVFGLAACGGGSKKTEAPAPEPVAEPEPAPEPEPPPPPPPKVWRATASLTATKGYKVKPVEIALEQTEGEATKIIAASIEGLKVGTYHLVFHTGAECGPSATKAGPAWPATAALALTIEVAKGAPAVVDLSNADLKLDGDDSVVGHTLVIHEDKKGKLGKAVACGPIASADAPADAEPEAEPAATE
jgi:Cu/Zn superoxide dismutase